MGSVHDHLRDVHQYTAGDFTDAAQLGTEIEAHADDHEAIDTLLRDARGGRAREAWAARVRRVDDNHAAQRSRRR